MISSIHLNLLNTGPLVPLTVQHCTVADSLSVYFLLPILESKKYILERRKKEKRVYGHFLFLI
jgi:hypothetical protein